MFIEIEEMRTVVQPYQMYDVTDNHDADIITAILAATEEVESYLTRYDTESIFLAEGDERSPLICEFVKTIALWYIMQKSNIDMQYDNIKDRYEKVCSALKGVADGTRTLKLPLLTNSKGESITTLRYGANVKFADPNLY